MVRTTLCLQSYIAPLSTTLWFQDNTAFNTVDNKPSIMGHEYHKLCRITS